MCYRESSVIPVDQKCRFWEGVAQLLVQNLVWQRQVSSLLGSSTVTRDERLGLFFILTALKEHFLLCKNPRMHKVFSLFSAISWFTLSERLPARSLIFPHVVIPSLEIQSF